MKKLIKNSVLFLSFILVFAQCQTESKKSGSHAKIVEINGNKMIDCNISEIVDTIDLPLSEVIKNCEFISLETNEESFFESVYHIGISENYIAIHSRGQMPIKLFSRDGKFIRDIGKIGRGPGEFNSLYGIQLDEAQNKIYLTPFANAKSLITYSLEGENIDPLPLAYKQTKCWAYVDNQVITVLSMPFEGSNIPVAYQQDLEGNVIQEVAAQAHQNLRPDFSSEISSSRNAGAFDHFILPWGSESLDTLYHYDTKINQMVPKFVVSFNDKKHGSWTREWKNHYWTAVFGDKYGGKIIVDKKTLKSDYFKLFNDFYGGIEMHKFFMSNNGMFICTMSALELITAFDEALKDDSLSSKERKKIETIQKSLNENDNEVLFIGEMI